METASFGLGLDFHCDNHDLGVAIDSVSALTVEADYDGQNMYYRIGELNDATVCWHTAAYLGKGKTPQVTLNQFGSALEVHESEDPSHAGDLWYSYGYRAQLNFGWPTLEKYHTGFSPSIALNDYNAVVEVHRGKSDAEQLVRYRVGTLKNNKISWARKDGVSLFPGNHPRVSMNNAGVMAIVSESTEDQSVDIWIAKLEGDVIALQAWTGIIDAWAPSVAFTNEFTGVVVCESKTEWGSVLLQSTFVVDPVTYHISIMSAVTEFGEPGGSKPSAAAWGHRVIELHEQSEKRIGLFSTSLLVDRAAWMSASPELSQVRIGNITFPAAHDAAMYTSGLSDLAKTQNENLYYQAMDGVRWFDLRPGMSSDGTIYLYHGAIAGPPLTDVLTDLKNFFQGGYRELLFLNFSHFSGWSKDAYRMMVTQIQDALGPWLYTQKPDGERRLSDLTLIEYIGTGGKALVTVDGNWAINDPQPGFWIYRTAAGPEVTNPVAGDLRVYDWYADTTDYDAMKANQFGKFDSYAGICADGSCCDLFLLSWTLTPITGVWFTSITPNSRLGNDIHEVMIPNELGYRMNQLYVDYVEYARPLDVALYLNGAAPR